MEDAVDIFERPLAGKMVTFRVRHSAGHWVFIEGIATILPESEDEPPQAVFNWRDITQRKLDEERLRNVEQRMRDIISHARVVVNEFDARGVMTMAEGNAIPSDPVAARGSASRYSSCSLDSHEITDALNGVLRGETGSTTAEVRGRGFDIWGEPVRDSDGKVQRWHCGQHRRHGARAGEQNLEQEKEQFRVLVENATDIILMLRRDGTVLFVSPSVERIADTQVEEVIGRTRYEFVHPDDMPSVMKRPKTLFPFPI